MSHPTDAPPRPPRAFLPEVQALRALAVGMVILFHLWPRVLPGGYVGVDVFFVISGFLITGHLLREIDSTGRVALTRFWARRIRRLLPAALVVLGATLAATILLMPEPTWQRTVVEISASAGYVLNWLLAADAVDYFAAESTATAVQHYWSLAVEEQFYVVWPVLLMVLVVAARRTGGTPRRWVTGGVVAVGATSLAYSVWFTHLSPAAAYFSTLTHGWEFAGGGLLALAGPMLASARWARGPRLRAAASITGLVGLVACAFLLDGATPFPGWVALVPVTATLLVIAAGDTGGTRLSPMPAMRLAPVRFLGEVSYSAYLWHWPLIVMTPVVVGRELDVRVKVLLLAGTLVLAWLSKTYVEDPTRTSPRFAARRRPAFALAGTGAAAVLAVSAIIWTGVAHRTGVAIAAADDLSRAAASARVDERTPEELCFGAGAVLSGADCGNPYTLDSDLLLATTSGTADEPPPTLVGGTLSALEYGDPASDTTIALVGDSHAVHYLSAVETIAERHGWRILVIRHNDCSPSAPTWVSPLTVDMSDSCQRWRQRLIDVLPAEASIDVVVTSSVSPRYGRLMPDAAALDEVTDAFTTTWQSWIDGGKEVVVIADVPGPGASVGETVDCVAASSTLVDPCTSTRAEVLETDPSVLAALEATDDRLTFVDYSDMYCDAELCHSVLGGLVVYRSGAHISDLFSSSLAPYLEEPLAAAVRASRLSSGT